MALTDNFESYSVSTLDGQGGWSGGSSWSVTTTQAHSGTKSTTVTNISQSESKLFTAQAIGRQSFWMYFSDTNGRCSVNILSGATIKEQCFIIGGVIKLNQAGITIVGSPTINTWYNIELDWDSTLGIRARANGGAWTSYSTTNSFTTLDTIQLASAGGSINGNTYFDDFTDTTLPVATGASFLFKLI